MDIYQVLKRPIVTEKSTLMNEKDKYVFEVDTKATKHQIKKAVQEAFDVTVLRVNTMVVRGKRKRFGPRFTKKKSWKKAVVTVASGNTITIFEGV